MTFRIDVIECHNVDTFAVEVALVVEFELLGCSWHRDECQEARKYDARTKFSGHNVINIVSNCKDNIFFRET
jgi:G:T-mismatch repair DNA endonuclease (very short patch repair protein)